MLPPDGPVRERFPYLEIAAAMLHAGDVLALHTGTGGDRGGREMNTLDHEEWSDTHDAELRWREEQRIRRDVAISRLRERQRALSDELVAVNRQLNMLGANDG